MRFSKSVLYLVMYFLSNICRDSNLGWMECLETRHSLGTACTGATRPESRTWSQVHIRVVGGE